MRDAVLTDCPLLIFHARLFRTMQLLCNIVGQGEMPVSGGGSLSQQSRILATQSYREPGNLGRVEHGLAVLRVEGALKERAVYGLQEELGRNALR